VTYSACLNCPFYFNQQSRPAMSLNWTTIKREAPDAFALVPQRLEHYRALYDFFDERHITVQLLHEAGRLNPWGWSVSAGLTEWSTSARYPTRLAAEQEAFELAFQELNKLILAGNA
jgi:hypothetical protein